jgi:phosphoribosylglycinamide formyltransferase 1
MSDEAAAAAAATAGVANLGVLISGRGTNLQALIDAVQEQRLPARIAVVISNRPAAAGLERARAAGIETLVIEHRAFEAREAFDAAIAEALRARRVAVVCLAGFMRLIGPPLLDAFPNAILNIHPSLLPAFPGVEAQRQALEHGVKITGATVHLVTRELDAGPIVLQAVVPVREDDTVDALSARILVQEHRIYPEAVRLVLAGGWRVEGRRFIGPASAGSPLAPVSGRLPGDLEFLDGPTTYQMPGTSR